MNSFLKVSKSRKQIFLFSILPKNEQKPSILMARILEYNCFVFGKIENKIICFWNLLTFSRQHCSNCFSDDLHILRVFVTDYFWKVRQSTKLSYCLNYYYALCSFILFKNQTEAHFFPLLKSDTSYDTALEKKTKKNVQNVLVWYIYFFLLYDRKIEILNRTFNVYSTYIILWALFTFVKVS